MARLALKLFGSYHLTLDGEPIDAHESDKGRALLAYLAIEHARPHSREKLVGMFWPEQNEVHARGSLSQAIYHLRGIVGDRPHTGELPSKAIKARESFLVVTPQEIQLNPQSDISNDVNDFINLVNACRAHHHPLSKLCDDCLRRYQDAAMLYCGDFLDGFYLPKSVEFEEWATIQREQLRLEVMGVLEQLVIAFERRGELDQALRHARRMAQLDELGETGNQHVMRLLALMDKREAALAQYALFRHQLAIELGAEPGMESHALYQRLRQEEMGKESGSIPVSLTPLIGRKQELDELWGMLRGTGCRLICILGPGGSGKSHLALEAARRQQYYFRHGAFYISLSALSASSSLLSAIAEGMDFTFRDGIDPKRQLLDYLRHKMVLLILDSFETVVGNAGLVVELLSASPESKALVTSRESLNVSGEYIFPLNGMRSPPPGVTASQVMDYSSVELFVEAARRVKPGYMPDVPEHVAQICRQLDGMPLSLLLASTWITDLTAQEIATQISRTLDFLSVDWVDLPERQRSLRATFEYSWKLLDRGEQDVLMKLSVFRSVFNTQAALHVTGASPQVLHALVSKSLLMSLGEGHFRLHDLVHQYSSEKLDLVSDAQSSFVHRDHSVYFLERIAGWCKVFKGPKQSAQLDEADHEIDDAQSAWEWAARRADLERLTRAIEGLMLYYSLRYRFQEGEHACKIAIEGLNTTPMASAGLNLDGWLLAWHAYFCRMLGRMDLSRQSANESLEMLKQAEAAGQDARHGQALLGRELGYLSAGLSEQLACFQRSADLFQSLGEPWWQAPLLAWGGEFANRLGDRHLALAMHQRALELSRTVGEPRILARSLMNLAYDHIIFWDWHIGTQMMEESASLYRSLADLGSKANADLHQAVSLIWAGRYSEGCAMLGLALEKLHQLGDRFYIAYGTLALGGAQMHAGWYEQAVITLQQGLAAARQDGYRREETFAMAVAGCNALMLGSPAEALVDLQTSVAGFRQMGFAGELGMALGGQALVLHALKMDGQALESLIESLHIAVDTSSRFTLFMLSAALVVILADAGRWEPAIEAHASMMTDPIPANSRWIADMIGNRMELARQHLGEADYQGVEARGQQGDIIEVLGRMIDEIKSIQRDSCGPALSI